MIHISLPWFHNACLPPPKLKSRQDILYNRSRLDLEVRGNTFLSIFLRGLFTESRTLIWKKRPVNAHSTEAQLRASVEWNLCFSGLILDLILYCND